MCSPSRVPDASSTSLPPLPPPFPGTQVLVPPPQWRAHLLAVTLHFQGLRKASVISSPPHHPHTPSRIP
eukprot:12919847-Prorocentrum_lima.AAC.1